MKTVFIVYVKSPEMEFVYGFLDRKKAEEHADKWGKYSAIYELQVKSC